MQKKKEYAKKNQKETCLGSMLGADVQHAQQEEEETIAIIILESCLMEVEIGVYLFIL